MADLNTYVYDCSMEGQFVSEDDAKNAIRELLAMVSILMDTQNVNVSILYNRKSLYQAMATAQLMFGAIMDKDRDLKKLWELKRMQLLSDDSVDNAAYVDVVAGKHVGLLCFRGSYFREPQVTLSNLEYKEACNVTVWVLVETLSAFLYKKNWLKTYSDATKYVPRDEQTILTDTALFMPTTHHNHKRKVYERIGRDEYWCCDNFHTGRSAELEVFRKSDLKHIGTCGIFDINTFNSSGAVPGRVMDDC